MDPEQMFARPGTPGYTGNYEVREAPRGDFSGITDAWLCAQNPDGTWDKVMPYPDIPSKGASDGEQTAI